MIEERPDVVRMPGDIGWPDRFMRFLGVGRFGLVGARCGWHKIGTEPVTNSRANGANCLSAKLDAVGPHIGDQAGGFAANADPLIQLLGDLHGAGC